MEEMSGKGEGAHLSVSSILVDVAVGEGGCGIVDVDTTALPTAKRVDFPRTFLHGGDGGNVREGQGISHVQYSRRCRS